MNIEYPRVAVTILNYNTSEMTIEAVKCLLASAKIPLFVTVVDNSSLLDDFDNLCSKLGLLGFQYHEIDDIEICANLNLLRTQKNLGYARGNNFGLTFSMRVFSPDYYVVMNSDVYVRESGTISRLITGIQEYGTHVVAAMPLVFNVNHHIKDPKYQVQIRKLDGFWGTLISGSPILRRVLVPVFNRSIYRHKMPFNSVEETYVLSGAFTIYKADFFESVGFFDENTFLYSEEIIIGFKMRERNSIGILVPSVKVDHLQGASTKIAKRFSGRLYYHRYRSALYYLSRYVSISSSQRSIFKLCRTVEAFILSVIVEGSLVEFKEFIVSRKGDSDAT